MVSAGSYLLATLQLTLVVVPLAFTAYRLRRRLLPSWQGAPARLIEATLAIALLIWLSELLGTAQIFYAGTLVAASVALAVVVYLLTGRGKTAVSAGAPAAGGAVAGGGRRDRTRGEWALSLITIAVMALVAFHWGITTHRALDHGIFNFDSLWYHLPFSASMVQSHSLTVFFHPETVFTNWFYPQNSELLHAVGILLTGRDTLSLFINFGWLAIAFLAAYCVGRPYGRGQLAIVASAVLLECHTLVVREPGAAKNDLAAAALLLVAIAILVNAWAGERRAGAAAPTDRDVAGEGGAGENGAGERERRLQPGWALAAAGLAVGMAAGTRVTVLAMAAALSLAILWLAPTGRRWAAAGWWFLPALAGGGFWYLRNLIAAGNPLPEVEHLGPISLPHPERLQEGRPNFNIVHYATDSGVWRHYFAPGAHQAFGALWPLVLAGIALAALLALLRGRDRIVRWSGGVALFGMLAYLFTPLSAAGADGAPTGFGINIRYAIPALLAGVVLVPLPRFFDDPRRRWVLLGVLLVALVVTDRPDLALRDPGRLFALLIAVLAVGIPALLWLARERGAGRGAVLGGAVALAVAVVAIGYPLQRHYLHERFRNQAAAESIPGMDLDSAYRWARGVEDSRIGLAGTTAGFAQYGFWGPDLSNRVIYLGEPGPHGAFNAIPTCTGFRAAVNAADLDYLVTSPTLNFLHPGKPIPSPEARWLHGESAVSPVLRSGPVTVWRVDGRLDPAACGPPNAPLREVPGPRTG